MSAVELTDAVGSWVAARQGRLARGLRQLRVGPGDKVMVLCCEHHCEDRQVAVGALAVIGAAPVLLDRWGDGEALRETMRSDHVRFFLACEEGVSLWKRSGGRGVMVGDGPEVIWWKALEARAARSDPREPAGAGGQTGFRSESR